MYLYTDSTAACSFCFAFVLTMWRWKQLTTRESAVTNARDTLCKEPFPAGLLLPAVVYLRAASFGWAEVALTHAGGVACPTQFTLTDFNLPLLTHS